MKKIYEDPKMTVMLVDTGDCMSVSSGIGAQDDDVADYSDIFGAVN